MKDKEMQVAICCMTQRMDFPNHAGIDIKNQLIARVNKVLIHGDLYADLNASNTVYC